MKIMNPLDKLERSGLLAVTAPVSERFNSVLDEAAHSLIGASFDSIKQDAAARDRITEDVVRGVRQSSKSRGSGSPYRGTRTDRWRQRQRIIGMTSLQRRIRKLEAPLAVHEVAEPSWVAVMRERQRRRAEAEGRPYVEPLREPLVLANGRCPTWAEVLRAHRARRCAESRRAETAEQ